MNFYPSEKTNFWRGSFFVLFAIAASIATFFRLHSFSDPTGLNGYFYLKQTKVLATTGSFYFSDHSLAFLPLVLFRWLTGSDLMAFQGGISATLAAAIFAIFYLVEGTPANAFEKAIAKILMAWALFSSAFFNEFSLGFFKNFFAATLLLWSVGFLLRERRRLAFFFFFLAFLSHKSAALVGGLYLFLQGVEYACGYRRWNRKSMFGILMCLGVVTAFSVLFLFHFPKATAFLEFMLRSFTSPEERFRWLGNLWKSKPQRVWEITAWVFILGAFALAWKQLNAPWRRFGLLCVLLFFVALHPFQQASASGLGYRQLLLLPLFLYPLATASLYFPKSWMRFAGLAPLGLVLFYVFSPLGLSRFGIERQIRPYSRYAQDVVRIRDFVRPDNHLTSHHGMEFYIDYLAGIRSRSFLADEKFQGERFRLAYLAKFSAEENDELLQMGLLSLKGDYVLLKEEDWDSFEEENDLSFDWRNHLGRRPAHVYE